MLGLKIPLNIFTSNLGRRSGVHFSRFAEDTELGRAMEDRAGIQRDLNRLEKGAERQMPHPVLGMGCRLQDGLGGIWPGSTKSSGSPHGRQAASSGSETPG